MRLWSPDLSAVANLAYPPDDSLYTIDLAPRTADSEPLAFSPTDMNLTPDDETLVLREDDDTLRLYDTDQSRITRTFQSQRAVIPAIARPSAPWDATARRSLL